MGLLSATSKGAPEQNSNVMNEMVTLRLVSTTLAERGHDESGNRITEPRFAVRGTTPLSSNASPRILFADSGKDLLLALGHLVPCTPTSVVG